MVDQVAGGKNGAPMPHDERLSPDEFVKPVLPGHDLTDLYFPLK